MTEEALDEESAQVRAVSEALNDPARRKRIVRGIKMGLRKRRQAMPA